MWQLAIKAMLADRAKLTASLLGVAFAVVLVNLQGGLLIGLIRKAALLVEHGGCDIWVGHRHTCNIDIVAPIPDRWIHRIRTIDGIERVDPYIVMFTPMSMPDGRLEECMLVGCDKAALTGNAWTMVEGRADAVRRPDAVLVDANDLERLGGCRVGDVREINGRRARVVGITRGIVGFSMNPYVFTTLDRARGKYLSGFPAHHCSYFLVKLKPGADRQTLLAAIRARAPELDAYDKDAYALICMKYWLFRTGIGISFGLAACLGLLVGLAVVAQTLHAAVAERIKEFATLKALGADDRCVARFLLSQALGSSGLGSILGLVLAQVLGRSLSSPRAPVELSVWVSVLSVLLVTVVCLVAAWVPYRRLCRLDPAFALRL